MNVFNVKTETIINIDNDHQPRSPLTPFQSKRTPDVSMEMYIKRLFVSSQCSDACISVAMVYIQRLMEKMKLSSLNAIYHHKLFLVAFVTAAKFMDDDTLTNKEYAYIGGITVKELNYMEVIFLFMTDFDLVVSSDNIELLQQSNK